MPGWAKLSLMCSKLAGSEALLIVSNLETSPTLGKWLAMPIARQTMRGIHPHVSGKSRDLIINVNFSPQTFEHKTTPPLIGLGLSCFNFRSPFGRSTPAPQPASGRRCVEVQLQRLPQLGSQLQVHLAGRKESHRTLFATLRSAKILGTNFGTKFREIPWHSMAQGGTTRDSTHRL